MDATAVRQGEGLPRDHWFIDEATPWEEFEGTEEGEA